MRAKGASTVLTLALLLLGLVLSLSGCGGAPSEQTPVEEFVGPASVPNDQPDPASSLATAEPSDPDQNTAAEAESSNVMGVNTQFLETGDEQVTILTWARAAGTFEYDDALTIYDSGQVEAIVRSASMDETVVQGAVSNDQLARMIEWVEDYSAFTRREMDAARAVLTTNLHGQGAITPSSDMQAEIASYATALFLELTKSQ